MVSAVMTGSLLFSQQTRIALLALVPAQSSHCGCVGSEPADGDSLPGLPLSKEMIINNTDQAFGRC